MRAAELEEGAIWAWWCRQSAEQGLAPDIEPALVQRVVELALIGNNTSDPAVGRRAAQPSAAAKQPKGRDQYATGP